MNSLLLKSIQLEYESSPLSIDEICQKHNIAKENLKGHSSWIKKLQPVYSSKPTTNSISEECEAETIEETEEEAESKKVKRLIVGTAKQILTQTQEALLDSQLTPRDIKDLSAALATVKDTLIGKDPTTQIVIDASNNTTLVGYAKQKLLESARDC